jgi:hypothetical protein
MSRYYFDTRDGEHRSRDDDGEDLPDLATAQKVAATSLAELARDVLPSSASRCLGVDVRDGEGPVLTTELTFHARSLR